jgi:hypothetical protein
MAERMPNIEQNVARLAALFALALATLGCPRTKAKEQHPHTDASATLVAAPVSAPISGTTTDASSSAASVDAAAPVQKTPTTREIGPYELPFDKSTGPNARTVYYLASRQVPQDRPARLLANIHGMCNPPGYACGYWIEAGANAGFLVCPTGNSRCGGPQGPPTWTESATAMDADLEKAIAIVDAKHPGEIGRDDSILTGFSMGASAAYQIARAHPGRWPYLILVESDVALDKAQLEKAGVRSVALIAGEIGSQIAGERKTATKLAKLGFPARLWVMKGAGHHYSSDIDAIMGEAIAFVLSTPAPTAPP